MLDPSWLPGIRSDLRQEESDCLNHIKNNTFDEEPFVEYFKSWESYYYIISHYSVPDIYDASKLGDIANYYNRKTNTTNYYNPSTGEKGTQERSYSSSSSSSSSNSSSSDDDIKEKIKDYAIIGGVALLCLLALRSCANGEEIDNSYVLVDSNNKKIEFFDNTYVKTDIREEVINPNDFISKTR